MKYLRQIVLRMFQETYQTLHCSLATHFLALHPTVAETKTCY